ncbi:MAG: S8 family serine peptidase [Candidatus Hermodarchaeota archaeon]
MNKKEVYSIVLLTIILISYTSIFLNFSNLSNTPLDILDSKKKNTDPSVSGLYNENIIIFFKKQTYNSSVTSRFEYYGGTVKEEWNNKFNSISGFAGIMPSEINKTAYQIEFPDAVIENNEILEAQMNYASIQSGAINSTGYLNGLMGNNESSVAVLDTGINPNHNYFPDGYTPLDLSGNIVGWQNFVDTKPIFDDNGHGTLISSIIAGTGTDSYDSINPSIIKIKGNYSHTELFEEYSPPRNYTLKIFSFNASKAGSNVLINSSWRLETQGIDKFWFELHYNNSLVQYSYNEIPDTYYLINHILNQDNVGVYDLYLKYHKLLQSNPVFSFGSEITLFPDFPIEDRNHFTGIANATKIVAYKILNQSGKGYTSNLISALARVIENRELYHIISVCLSIGTLGEDVHMVNTVIDEVIENGILVVIAAGNAGIEVSDSLNKLAVNKNAIVVGAINDKDQITSYSSIGENLENITKPDIVAPGGSKLPGHRSIIGASDENDKAAASYGTSIASAIVSAAINILIDAKWDNWNQWNNLDLSTWVKTIKAILLMTASETNLDREDDPSTTTDESEYSPTLNHPPFTNELKDIHEGYGRLNIEAAIDALTKKLNINSSISGNLISSQENPLGTHVFARQIIFEKDIQYSFKLSVDDSKTDFDMYLFSNKTNQYGEPILLRSSRHYYDLSNRRWYDIDDFYFTPKKNQTNCFVVIKAINGSSDFTLNFSSIKNLFKPELNVAEINYADGFTNTTVMGFQEFMGMEPKKNYSIDQYRFYIEYFDNDSSNVPPQEVTVHITELTKNFTMYQLFTAYSEPDDIYTDGALFVSDYIQFPKPGLYHYYFLASDGKFSSRYPSMGELNITIEFPTDSVQFPNYHSFNEGIGNWTYIDTGWGIMSQENTNDNRSRIYQDNWHSMYFGTYHNNPNNYTYTPIRVTEDPYPNGTLISPLYNLTGVNQNESQPFAKFGYRVSFNSGDLIQLQINLNWTGWITIRTYTNIEQEWFMEEINLTQYIDNFIQFRFVTSLDEDYDSINYKGFMLDHFAIVNYTNNNSPLIGFNLNDDISTTQDSKYQKYKFSIEYFDYDNNYPEFVYLEIDSTNYTMYNIYGDWNASSNIPSDWGIYFSRSILLEEIANQSFRFHISDGKYINTSQWYNKDNSLFRFINPTPLQFNLYKDYKYIGYEFSNLDLDDYYVTGSPTPKENTAWFRADNTWHPIKGISQDYIYGGRGQSFGGFEQGYGINWDSNLITQLLHLGDDHKVYLEFDYEISLQNEFYQPEDQLDGCIISISKDFGETWIILREFTYDSEDLSGSKKFDISQYSGEDILIMFTLHSNDNVIGLGNGWLLSNIYIGYDKTTDFIPPEIRILNPEPDVNLKSLVSIEANVSDNKDLDEERIYIFLNNKSVDRNKLFYNINTSILEFNWNTISFNDGQYEIRVVAYDKEGNKGESYINVIVNNGRWWLSWGPYIILLGAIAVVSITLFVIAEKKGKIWIQNIKNIRAEKIRLRDIDKDQLIKRIELIEPDEELQRPLTLYCKSCRSWFLANQFSFICPVCEEDQIYASYHCSNCKKWTFKDEPGENYYCKNKKCQGVRLVRKEKEEIEEILAKEGKFPREFKRKNKKFSILDI